MEANSLADLLAQTNPGSRLRLTFKQANGEIRPDSSPENPKYFIDWQMVETLRNFQNMLGEALLIRVSEALTITITLHERYWKEDASRVFRVIVHQGFDAGECAMLLAEGLEKVEILS